MSIRRTSNEQLIDELIQYVYQIMARGGLRMTDLANHLSMSRSQLNRRIHEATGKPVSIFVMQLRVEEAKRLLAQSPLYTINETALACGFSDTSHFSRSFHSVTGMSPTAYINHIASTSDDLNSVIKKSVRRARKEKSADA